jgi:hypothetical protein
MHLLITAIAPAPDGDAKATIVSCAIIFRIWSKILKHNVSAIDFDVTKLYEELL